jgi:hypothetical protein
MNFSLPDGKLNRCEIMIYKLISAAKALHSAIIPAYKWELVEGKEEAASNNTLIQIQDKRFLEKPTVASIWYPGRLTEQSSAILAKHLISIIDGNLPRNPEIPKNQYGIGPIYRTKAEEAKYGITPADGERGENQHFAVRCNDSDLFRLTFAQSSLPGWETWSHKYPRNVAKIFLGHLPQGAIQLRQPKNPDPVNTSSPHL